MGGMRVSRLILRRLINKRKVSEKLRMDGQIMNGQTGVCE